MQLRQPEHEHERRHEDDPAADAEQPGEDSSERADQRRRARSSYEEPHSDGGEQQREAVREPLHGDPLLQRRRRARTPNTAGMPTSAAAPSLTSPWNP